MKKLIILGIIFLLFLQVSISCFAETKLPEVNGVGIILGEKNKKLYVKGIFPDSPAAKAGVQQGDVIEEFKRSRDFEKLEVYDWHKLNMALKSSPGSNVALKLNRRGRIIEVNMVSAKIPVTYNNLPGTDARNVKILEYEGFQGKASTGSSDGSSWGDKYLVFNGREYLGIATIGDVASNSSQVRVQGNLTDTERSKLKGAEMYFYESSPRNFNKYKKPPSVSVHPTYKKYWQKCVKHECKILTGCKITKINKTTGVVSIESHRAQRIYPSSQWAKVYTVKTDFHYTRGKTEFLPTGAGRTLKVGDNLDIFYTEENGKKNACLIAKKN